MSGQRADTHEREPIRTHTIDYAKRDDNSVQLLNRGFWVHNLPRLMPLCRIFGHRPVIDGVILTDRQGNPSRWVCCDRCGIRAGHVTTDIPIGSPWTGPLPGQWPHATGEIGGQVIALGHLVGPSIELTVGCAGAEHGLSGHISLGRLFGLYLHTNGFGTWLQRRLVPTGYYSRQTGVAVHDGTVWGHIWAREGHSSYDDPRWMRWTFPIDPRDILLGPARYSYTDHGDPTAGVVRMPHGDDHAVTLQLQRQTFGRRRGRKRLSWTVHWETMNGGIPTKLHHRGGGGGVTASAVAVSGQAVRERTWPAAACAKIADQITGSRTRYGYRPDLDGAAP